MSVALAKELADVFRFSLCRANMNAGLIPTVHLMSNNWLIHLLPDSTPETYL